jgi:hypothetical protein
MATQSRKEDRSVLVGALVAAALVVLVGGYFWFAFAYDPELSHKSGWSVLQGFEFDERAKPFVSSELRRTRDGTFAAISVLGVGEPKGGPTDPPQVLPGKAWVLLNEHAADKTVLIMPQFASYKVSCATVGRLPSAVPDVDGYALKYLSAICS